MNFDVLLGKVNGCVTEGDNGCSGIGIKLVEEWELLIAHDSSGLLRTILEAHEADQDTEHADFEE